MTIRLHRTYLRLMIWLALKLRLLGPSPCERTMASAEGFRESSDGLATSPGDMVCGSWQSGGPRSRTRGRAWLGSAPDPDSRHSLVVLARRLRMANQTGTSDPFMKLLNWPNQIRFYRYGRNRVIAKKLGQAERDHDKERRAKAFRKVTTLSRA
jgi:hypothetical protein